MGQTITQRRFLKAVVNNDIATVIHALDNGVSPNFEQSVSSGLMAMGKRTHVSPVYVAAVNNNIDLMAVLLSASANPNTVATEKLLSETDYVSPLLATVRTYVHAQNPEQKAAAQHNYIALRAADAVIYGRVNNRPNKDEIKENISTQLAQTKIHRAWKTLENAYENEVGESPKPVTRRLLI